MRRIATCLAGFLFSGVPLGAQQVSRHAEKAVQAIRELRAIGVPQFGNDDFTPSPKVPPLLRQLNQELKALIIEDLNDRSLHEFPSEEEIREKLIAAG
jgi:hypothetical protein